MDFKARILKKLEYVAARIGTLEGVVASQVDGNGLIEATIAGPNRDLKAHIVEMCKRAMMPVKVVFQVEDKALNESQLQEMGYFSPVMSMSPSAPVPCDTYARDMLDFLNVQGPIGNGDRSEPVTVPGFATEPPEAPADEIATAVDGAERLKRIRSGSRGRPVVGWKIGDKTLRVGSQLKVTNDCYIPWQQGRTIGLKPGSIVNVSELSSRYPIVYGNIGDYTGLEIPVHSLGRTMELVISNGDQNEETEKASDDKLFGFEGVHNSHTSQVECTPDCGCDSNKKDGDELLSPKKKPFKKKK
jgi:hypothetical protein